MTGDPSAAARLARLADGYLATQLLFAAVALGVPEALAAGPRSADDLARELGAAPGPLHRVLRGLAAEEVVEEQPDGRFALTAVGAHLLPDAPVSLRGVVTARGEVYYEAAAGLVGALRGGARRTRSCTARPSSPTSPRTRRGSPRSRRRWPTAPPARPARSSRPTTSRRSGRSSTSAGEAACCCGPSGSARRTPTWCCSTAPRWSPPSTIPACARSRGDFFDAVPAGADAYLLSRVLHDWDDQRRAAGAAHLPGGDAARLGARRRRGGAARARRRRPGGGADGPAHARAAARGRERTAAEYAALFDAADLRLTADVPTRAGVHVLEARVR